MNFKRLKILRVAARVVRCHTTPTIHLQSVGEHTFGALNILYTIHHAPSAQLVRALLWHDVPEAITGDVPAPAKRYSSKIREGLLEAESKIIKEYDLMDDCNLTPFEKQMYRYCDLMELAMFAAEEADMGNEAAIILHRRALGFIKSEGIGEVTQAAKELTDFMVLRMEKRYDQQRAESVLNGWYGYDEG